jgi:mRNA interferase RelE/StbE
MESYKIQWKHSTIYDLQKIDPQKIHRIFKAVEDLAENPFPNQSRKLRGGEYFYRIR